ncbi:formin-like protein 2 [Platysternon megacephalum]|uniref:Formin-like protein 2 n=1 Tax=Platysternon megacephalum TaxID=55544 RepID=A0A4D9ETR0_9SAUR|nr:formin-like protein 2 [Platysternon megacephalum]
MQSPGFRSSTGLDMLPPHIAMHNACSPLAMLGAMAAPHSSPSLCATLTTPKEAGSYGAGGEAPCHHCPPYSQGLGHLSVELSPAWTWTWGGGRVHSPISCPLHCTPPHPKFACIFP